MFINAFYGCTNTIVCCLCDVGIKHSSNAFKISEIPFANYWNIQIIYITYNNIIQIIKYEIN